MGIRKDLDKIIKETPIKEEDRILLQEVFDEYWKSKRAGKL